ncbi:Aspartyl/glutamyl-tRNA(Asn/Gln) amidotransferase subunit B [Pirellula sp. SH-Sr6A]|uniref:Asp-tRNA(Asn)/Glu-tRNA(Gln) amidotransferase subunit GatB n=1 Tax=Pirellula sp. SH-Sr6A TaxID=1632865 RepID=UPI00078E6346|nr:Asp-tRNA(Asn)/Glu-tRNA(Gln) amidotransferase subunit GatB [Pirellula sp. SH-Sr6A]AMV35002.1 Aspartyl/glutamyl-tRNA(Asn/Gln) amidotransferase subunit B [Pirellula sp. SH-Sr6A]
MSHLYRTVIGLEVHVQLKTATKLFCRCRTDFGASPNTQVCPVCLGLPGSLPVLNDTAIRYALRAGIGLHSEIARFTKWDRKNYFYPDLPKGYQTSQFDLPICGPGYLEIESLDDTGAPCPKKIRILRAHLEEDAGKSLHDEVAGKADTRIDLNRAGTPLLEIVSEPDLRSAEDAKNYLVEMRLLMMYLGITDGNMQEGSLRADANVNLHIQRDGKWVATPIVEIKNLNSFRSVERAIQYESQRQYEQFLADGKTIGEAPKQTRGWDDDAGVTEMQREKEDSADYRYFPCPDLVPVLISDADIAREQPAAAITPRSARENLVGSLGLRPADAEILIQQGRETVEYFLAVVKAGATPKRAIAWMLQDVLRILNDRAISVAEFPIPASALALILIAIEKGTLDTARGREVFAKLLDAPEQAVEALIQAHGVVAVDAGELESLCRELLNENPDVIAKVKSGNAKAISALIGQARKKNKNADPRQVQETCLQLIETSY